MKNPIDNLLEIVEGFWNVYGRAPRLNDIHVRGDYPNKRFTLWAINLLVRARYLRYGHTGVEINYNWPDKE